MTALLEVRNVSKYFGGVRANNDVTFSVEKGTVLGLIGPNGAGKTTLFNCITGFYPPTRGDVFFDG
jgi:branched-chain amino acid transport system ATP-binding protein